MSTVATKPLPPPAKAPPRPAGSPAAAPVSDKKFTISSGRNAGPQRIGIFGGPAVGKSELAANLKEIGINPIFFDLEHGSNNLDVARVEGIETLDDLRAGLRADEMLNDFGAVVIDSGTVAQELCEAWVCANLKTEKGHTVSAVSEFPYGKGVEHTYDAFLRLMGDLDMNIRKGRHVIVICHQCTEMVPNSQGEDFLQTQPRLQLPKSGKNSIRHRLIEWCDHFFYIGYDKIVDDDGKARGSGTRTIYCSELPSYIAKSRTISDPIPYEKGSAELWRQLLGIK